MIYEAIEKLRPYFRSIREIDDNVSLDIKFPAYWKIEYEQEGLNIIPQDKNDKFNLVSFIMKATPEGYESVFSVVQSIIKSNLEREEKEKLFQNKMKELKENFEKEIRELKEVFAKEPLDKLKENNFLQNEGITSTIETGDGVAGEGS